MNFEALPADEFWEEAQELLQEIEESLLLLEEDPVDQNVIQRLFRSAHTLKGGAAMVGLSDLANHAHEFEAILSQLRSGTLTSTPEIVSLLLKGKDNFSSILNPIIGNSTSSSSHSTNENQPTHQLTDIQSPQESRTSDLKSDNPQIQKNVYLLHLHFDQSFLEQGQEPLLLIRQLEGLGETTVIVHTSQIPPWTEFDQQKLYLWWSIKLVTEKTAEEIDTLLEFYRWKESDLSIEKVETPVEEAKEVQDAHQNMLQQISDGESVDQLTFAESTKTQYEDPEEAVEIPKVSQTIRVPVSRLDRLQNLVSETVIRQARLLRLNEAIQATDDELGEQFLQFVEDNEQAVRELQDQIQQVRMVPVGTIFSPMKRVVREFATRHQKQIKLEIYGAETELDKTITEQIQGSLMHLLRNAMDHGLEAPEQRRESAKNPIGTITLQASHQAGFVVVEVKDDGRGLDPDKILAAGRRLGIVAEDHHPSEQEALQLIFQPGFTTTRE